MLASRHPILAWPDQVDFDIFGESFASRPNAVARSMDVSHHTTGWFSGEWRRTEAGSEFSVTRPALRSMLGEASATANEAAEAALTLSTFTVDPAGTFVSALPSDTSDPSWLGVSTERMRLLWWWVAGAWHPSPPPHCESNEYDVPTPRGWQQEGVTWRGDHWLTAHRPSEVRLEFEEGPDEEAMNTWMEANGAGRLAIPPIASRKVVVVSDPRNLIPYSLEVSDRRTEFMNVGGQLYAVPSQTRTIWRFHAKGLPKRTDLLGLEPLLPCLDTNRLWIRCAGDPLGQWREVAGARQGVPVDDRGIQIRDGSVTYWAAGAPKGGIFRTSHTPLPFPPPEEALECDESEDPPPDFTDADIVFRESDLEAGGAFATIAFAPSKLVPDHPHHYSTRVINTGKQRFRVRRFGGFHVGDDGGLRQDNFTGALFRLREWIDWYSTPEDGWLDPGEAGQDSDNWGGGVTWWCYELELEDGRRFWVGGRIDASCDRHQRAGE